MTPQSNHRHAPSVRALAFAALILAPPLLSAGCASRNHEDADIEFALDHVPPAPRRTITEHLSGATLIEIERSRDRGVTVYEVEARAPSGPFEFIVAEDGAYLGPDDEDRSDEEPGDDDEDSHGDSPGERR